MKIKIPNTIEKAEDRLTSLDGLLTAAGWERAAIVYAFTHEQVGRPGKSLEVVTFTILGFTKLKIAGLKSQDTIRSYRDAWKDAMASGDATDIEPGSTVTLPTIPFPPQDKNTGSRVSADPAKAVQQVIDKHGATAVASHTATVAPAAVAQQAQKPAVAKQIAHDPLASRTVMRQKAAKTQEVIQKRKEAINAAGPEVKGQVAAVADAAGNLGAMDVAPETNTISRGIGEARRGWNDGIKKQSFRPFDRHLLAAELSSYERFLEEIRAFVEADDDPYDALAAHRAEVQEEFQREMDEAEGETTLDTDEIERFANESS